MTSLTDLLPNIFESYHCKSLKEDIANKKAENRYRKTGEIIKGLDHSSEQSIYAVTIDSAELLRRFRFGRIGYEVHVLNIIFANNSKIEIESKRNSTLDTNDSLSVVEPGDRLLNIGETSATLLESTTLEEILQSIEFPVQLTFARWWPLWNERYQEIVESLGLISPSEDIQSFRVQIENRLYRLKLAFASCAAKTIELIFKGEVDELRPGWYYRRGQLLHVIGSSSSDVTAPDDTINESADKIIKIIKSRIDAARCLRDTATLLQWTRCRICPLQIPIKSEKGLVREIVHFPLVQGLRYFGHSCLAFSIPPGIKSDKIIRLKRNISSGRQNLRHRSGSISDIKVVGYVQDLDNNPKRVYYPHCLAAAQSIVKEALEVSDDNIKENSESNNSGALFFFSSPRQVRVSEKGSQIQDEAQREAADARMYIMLPNNFVRLSIKKPVVVPFRITTMIPSNSLEEELWMQDERPRSEFRHFVLSLLAKRATCEELKSNEQLSLEESPIHISDIKDIKSPGFRGSYDYIPGRGKPIILSLGINNKNDNSISLPENTRATALTGTLIYGDAMLVIQPNSQNKDKIQRTKIKNSSKGKPVDSCGKSTETKLERLSRIRYGQKHQNNDTYMKEPEMTEVHHEGVSKRDRSNFDETFFETVSKQCISDLKEISTNTMNTSKEKEIPDASWPVPPLDQIQCCLRRHNIPCRWLGRLRKSIWIQEEKKDREYKKGGVHNNVDEDCNTLGWGNKVTADEISKSPVLEAVDKALLGEMIARVLRKRVEIIWEHQYFNKKGASYLDIYDSIKLSVAETWQLVIGGGVTEALSDTLWQKVRVMILSGYGIDALSVNERQLSYSFGTILGASGLKVVYTRLLQLLGVHGFIETNQAIQNGVTSSQLSFPCPFIKQDLREINSFQRNSTTNYNCIWTPLRIKWHNIQKLMTKNDSGNFLSRQLYVEGAKNAEATVSQRLRRRCQWLGSSHTLVIEATLSLIDTMRKRMDALVNENQYNIPKEDESFQRKPQDYSSGNWREYESMLTMTTKIFRTLSHRCGGGAPETIRVIQRLAILHEEAGSLYRHNKRVSRGRPRSLSEDYDKSMLKQLRGNSTDSISAFSAPISSTITESNNTPWHWQQAEKLRTLALSNLRGLLTLKKTHDENDAKTYHPAVADACIALALIKINDILQTLGNLCVVKMSDDVVKALKEIEVSKDNIDTAKKLFTEAIAIQSSTLPENSTARCTPLLGIARIHTWAGEYEMAQTIYLEALGLARGFGVNIVHSRPKRNNSGVDHNCKTIGESSNLSRIAHILSELAIVQIEGGNRKLALKTLVDAVAAWKIADGSSSTTFARALETLAKTHATENSPTATREAIKVFGELLSVQRSAPGNETSCIASTLFSMGKMQQRLQRHEDAIDLFAEALNVYRKHVKYLKLQPGSEKEIEYLLSLARSHANLENWHESLAVYEDAMPLLRQNIALTLHKKCENSPPPQNISDTQKNKISVSGSLVVVCGKEIAKLYFKMHTPKRGVKILEDLLADAKIQENKLKNNTKMKSIIRVITNDCVALNRALAQLFAVAQPCTTEKLEKASFHAKEVLNSLRPLHRNAMKRHQQRLSNSQNSHSQKKKTGGVRVHPLLLKVADLLGIIQQRLGEFDAAASTYEELLQWRHDASGYSITNENQTVSVKAALVMRRLAYVYLQMNDGKASDAIDLFERAKEACQVQLGESHPAVHACKLGSIEAHFKLASEYIRKSDTNMNDVEVDVVEFASNIRETTNTKLSALLESKSVAERNSSHVTALIMRCKAVQLMMRVRRLRMRRRLQRGLKGKDAQTNNVGTIARNRQGVALENSMLDEASDCLSKSLILGIRQSDKVEDDVSPGHAKHDKKIHRKKHKYVDLNLWGDISDFEVSPEITITKRRITQLNAIRCPHVDQEQICKEILIETKSWHGDKHASVVEAMTQLAIAKLNVINSNRAKLAAGMENVGSCDPYLGLRLMDRALKLQWSLMGTEHPSSVRISRLFARWRGRCSSRSIPEKLNDGDKMVLFDTKVENKNRGERLNELELSTEDFDPSLKSWDSDESESDEVLDGCPFGAPPSSPRIEFEVVLKNSKEINRTVDRMGISSDDLSSALKAAKMPKTGGRSPKMRNDSHTKRLKIQNTSLSTLDHKSSLTGHSYEPREQKEDNGIYNKESNTNEKTIKETEKELTELLKAAIGDDYVESKDAFERSSVKGKSSVQIYAKTHQRDEHQDRGDNNNDQYVKNVKQNSPGDMDVELQALFDDVLG